MSGFFKFDIKSKTTGSFDKNFGIKTKTVGNMNASFLQSRKKTFNFVHMLGVSPIWHGGGATLARTDFKKLLRLIERLKVPKYCLTFPIYISTNFWNKILNIFLRGCPPGAPSKKCHLSRKKIKNHIFTWPLIFITESETTMKTKMFAKNQSSKQQKLTELLKFWVPLKKFQDFLENPHAVYNSKEWWLAKNYKTN